MRLTNSFTAGAILAVFLSLIPASQALSQQQGGFQSPSALASEILTRFHSATAEDFAAVYPFPDGRELVDWAIKESVERVPGFARVLKMDGDRGVIVVSGVLTFGNSGNETSAARGFSELYEVRKQSDPSTWEVTRLLPLDTLGVIRRQRLDVDLSPGHGMHITDTLSVRADTDLGWAARLNHSATVSTVHVNGAPSQFEFGGGLLWVDAEQGESEIVLTYDIDVAADSASDPNSARFDADYGHVRNQYFWHPFTWFDNADTHFEVTVHAPAEFAVATDLVQTDRIAGSRRTTRGVTYEPTMALTLFYDRGWEPTVIHAGSFVINLFTTRDFTPSPESLKDTFLEVVDVLEERFGPAPAGSVSIVQSRARPGSGWNYRSNNAITTPRDGGGSLSRAHAFPRAWYGHEVAHGWTRPTGPAANFLREGWATYVESLLLDREYGADVMRDFWEMERNIYETRGYNGTASILDDPNNDGVAYSKGAWIFRSLESVLGKSVFDMGIQNYLSIPAGEKAGIEEFTDAVSHAAGVDVAPVIMPWVTESLIPDIRLRLDGETLIVTQAGPIYSLVVDVDLETVSGTVRERVHIDSDRTEVDITGLSRVLDARLDPDHKLLLRRTKGEYIHLEYAGGAANEVLLNGDLASGDIPARYADGIWRVDLLVSEGTYMWRWVVDGHAEAYHSLRVDPVVDLSETYPR